MSEQFFEGFFTGALMIIALIVWYKLEKKWGVLK